MRRFPFGGPEIELKTTSGGSKVLPKARRKRRSVWEWKRWEKGKCEKPTMVSWVKHKSVINMLEVHCKHLRIFSIQQHISRSLNIKVIHEYYKCPLTESQICHVGAQLYWATFDILQLVCLSFSWDMYLVRSPAPLHWQILFLPHWILQTIQNHSKLFVISQILHLLGPSHKFWYL